MILLIRKFFNRIFKNERKKLIKYFFYAFGELILIIAGIFIGLKATANYEESKRLKLVDEYINEMKIDLKNSIQEIDMRITYLEKDTKFKKIFLNSDIDSVETNDLYRMVLGTNIEFKLNNQAYLKYKDLVNKIKPERDSLDKKIFNYYNYDFNKFNLFTSMAFDSYKKRMDFLTYENSIDLTGNSNFKIFKGAKLNRREKLISFIKSNAGANTINDSYRLEENCLHLFKGFRNKTNELLKEINKKTKPTTV